MGDKQPDRIRFKNRCGFRQILKSGSHIDGFED